MARNFSNNVANYLSTATTYIVPPIPSTYTIAGWCRPTTLGQQSAVYGQGVGSSADYILLELTGANKAGLLCKTGNVVAADALSTTTATINTWCHLCGVQSSPTLRTAYLNGGGAGTSTSSCSPNAPNGTIGILDLGGAGSRYNPFPGDIAEVAVWSVALDANEVAALAAGTSPLLVRPSGLRGYWPLLGRNSPETDPWRGNDMTVHGTLARATHPRMFYPKRRQVGLFFGTAGNYKLAGRGGIVHPPLAGRGGLAG